ncbi:major facilitator superfamily domain-containing protein [Aspergillus alliaceus]|uniref:major facilitator superfamily domain-containing protein n=1 Tax=Petromyces alliaceus TaxID=209559 RepID=UPI0012A45587|nr:major facilitator superfamily domain-containing protein [Aspergillus alliaceus]KAB8236355.1 major facilitator superfamily domain-containing protein [Aspergillus alliaceus]
MVPSDKISSDTHQNSPAEKTAAIVKLTPKNSVAKLSNHNEDAQGIGGSEQPFSILSLTTLLPLTGSMYYPVITMFVTDLNVSIRFAPSFIGNLSDETGRRPSLIICFVVYFAACIGAVVKGDYALLMCCLQSAGSSAERGRPTSYVQMCYMVGPAFGPFITIFASVVFIVLLIFLPETSRKIVDIGSIPAQTWNVPLFTYLCTRIAVQDQQRLASPLHSLKLFLNNRTSVLLLHSGLIYASSYTVLSNMPDQLQEKYGLGTLHNLCYFAPGIGAMPSILVVGRLPDWYFRRYAKRFGLELNKDKLQDLTDISIKIARLQVCLPLLLFTGISLIAYGWTMQARTPLATLMIFLFLQSFGSSSAFLGFSNLIIDLDVGRC